MLSNIIDKDEDSGKKQLKRGAGVTPRQTTASGDNSQVLTNQNTALQYSVSQKKVLFTLETCSSTIKGSREATNTIFVILLISSFH